MYGETSSRKIRGVGVTVFDIHRNNLLQLLYYNYYRLDPVFLCMVRSSS